MMISFKGAQFPKEVILFAVFFYVRYTVSYRDLEEILAERGVQVDHATLNRWVTKYSPLIAANARRRKAPTHRSWRMDETYIQVKGDWVASRDQDDGYDGAYSTSTEYLRLIRPAVPRQFERRFETAPGRQAQVDFAEFQVEFRAEPGVLRKVWLFSMVLGHSRWLWGRFCPNHPRAVASDRCCRCPIVHEQPR
jgi:transposase